MRFTRSLLVFLLVLCGTLRALPALAEERIALIIGNAAYKDSPLKNPANDARAMATKLKQLGFVTIERENATRQQMAEAIAEFGRRLTPSSVSLVFFAGHGVQLNQRNYLLPVDIKLTSESDLRFQAIDVTSLLEELDAAKTRVGFVILDACRNNPFGSKLRGRSGGLAAIDAARGLLIAYSTAPGSVADDGVGNNSPYTGALLDALATPNLKAEEVFKRARIQVTALTKNQQTPWESSSLTGDFVFNLQQRETSRTDTATTPVAPAPVDREALFWQSITATNRLEEYEAYLQQYPQGAFALLARQRIASLKAPAPAAAPPLQPAAKPSTSKASLPAPPTVNAPEKPEVESPFRDCPKCPEMVMVPAGVFMMGAPDHEPNRRPDDNPVHQVTIKPFAIGKFEITYEEWDHCFFNRGCRADLTKHSRRTEPNQPATYISYSMAQEYLRWLSKTTGKTYRLPSEAEWEYAARGGTKTAFNTGTKITTKQAHFGRSPFDAPRAKPVGSYPPNGFGLHDMHGNVGEWTADCYHPSYENAPTDGSAWEEDNCRTGVLRGGSLLSGTDLLRSAARYKTPRDAGDENYGFRVVREP